MEEGLEEGLEEELEEAREPARESARESASEPASDEMPVQLIESGPWQPLSVILEGCLWILPLIWPFFYGLILYSINLVTSQFGKPLYLILGNSLIVGSVGSFLMVTLPIAANPYVVKHFWKIMSVWLFVILMSSFSMTQGAWQASFEKLAGRPMQTHNR